MTSDLRSTPSLNTANRRQEEVLAPRTVQILLFAVLAGLTLGFATSRDFPERPLLGIAMACTLIGLVCSHLGRQTWALRITIFTTMSAALNLVYAANDGLRSIAILMLVGVLVTAALLLDSGWFVGLAALTVGFVTYIGLRELDMVAHGHIIVRSVTRPRTVIQIDVILTIVGLAAGLLGRGLRASLQQTRQTVAQLDRANKELQDSENRFRSLVELAVDAIFITNGAGQILDVNQRACSLTGYPKEKLLGWSIAEVFSCGAQESLSGSEQTLTTETEVVCADGSRVNVELNSKTMPLGMVQIFCRDVTERQHAEEQIRQMQKMESIGRLAGGVAHDFNNLLTVIGGYSDLLLDRMDADDRGRQSVREIHAAAEQAAGLTQQLLAFSRKQESHPQQVEVGALVESARNMLRRLLGEDIEVTVRRDSRPALVLADPVQLHQVLVNLAVNGRDAMPNGGKLTLATGAARLGAKSMDSGGEITPGEYVSLSVTDTGSGMTDDIQKKIFEPFFTTKEVGKGTGLGLATVYGIVHQYKGFIDVRSAPGKGSTFTVYFPLMEGAARVTADAQAVEVEPGSETVLVAEDQDAVRELTAAILRSYGYRVLDAANGEMALQVVRNLPDSERIDLILTDVVMPRMNGRELVERVLVLQPQAKVLYVSGYSHDIIAPRNLPAGGVNLLAKPFTPEALATIVRKVLDEADPAHLKSQGVTG